MPRSSISRQMVKAAPALMKYQAWRSVYSIVSSFVKNEKLRQALSFHTLLVGGNPMTTSAIYALIHKLEKDGGVWFAQGRHQPAGRGDGRRSSSGWAARCGWAIRSTTHRDAGRPRDRRRLTAAAGGGEVDAVASNGDVMHTYRDLLAALAQRAAHACASCERSAGRRRCSSSISGSRAPGRASRTT